MMQERPGAMEPRTTPAVNRIVELVRETAVQCGSDRLPSTRLLCRRFGCSGRTLNAALAVLRHDDTLRVVAGGGIYAGAIPRSGNATAIAPSTSIRTTATWERVRDAIIADVNNGLFAPGRRLPLIKQLSDQYGANPRTLRKALTAVCASGRIVPRQRGFRVFESPPRPAGGTIMLVAATRLMGILGSLTPRTAELWRAIEQECRRANVALEVVESAAIDRPELRRRARRAGPLLGFIVLSVYMQDRDLMRLADDLASTGRPVAILDETTNTAELQDVIRNRFFRFYLLGSGTQAGRIVGEFLLRYSHRRAAYFQLVPHDRSNELRGAGIADAFDRAGFPGGVEIVMLDEYESADAMYAGLERSEVPASINRRVSFIWSDPRVAASSEYMPFLPSTAQSLAMFCFMREAMEPLFERTLRDRSVTAWVAYNDLLAFVALEFLRRNKIRLPRQLSLVGFDDSLEAFGNGLASYNFNVAAIVHTMIEHVLGPARRTETRSETVEVPGFVMPRFTAGSARRTA